MFVTVWMLYVGDRLLDARQLFSDPLQTAGLEARHLFHHRHRAAFLLGIVVASITLAGLLPRIQVEALHLYLVLGSVLIGYFLLIHGASKAHRLPKELAVGFFFAAATFIPTVAGHPQLRVGLLAPALLLASVCSLNCLFIFAWEHEPKGDDAAYVTAHATTRFAARNLPLLAGLVVVAGLLLALFDQVLPWHFFAACTGSAVLLLFLHRQRRLIDATLLRSAADLALLTPIVFLLVMHR